MRMSAIIKTLKDGPLWITGEYEIYRADGSLIRQGDEASLCRCGRSGDKPFCDDSHKAIAFINDGSGGRHAFKPTDATSGGTPLKVTLKGNGPLRCTGAMKVLDANGAVLFAGAQTALCRCGASSNKPFCDGSHATGGFSVP
jgi:CDGSH-type Zn-finger protein